MRFFEYLLSHRDIVLMCIGLIGFIISLVVESNDFCDRLMLTSVFCISFFIGLILHGDNFFSRMFSRTRNVNEHYLTIRIDDIRYLTTRINTIQKDVDVIKDKLKIEEE